MTPRRSLGGVSLIATALASSLVASACSDDPSPSSSSTDAGGAEVSAQVPRADDSEIPCDVRAVLKSVCQQCHSSPTKNGAPFPLVGHNDILRVTEGLSIRERMIEQLQARRMPLTPVQIDDDSRNLLLGWLRTGAPYAPPSTCDSGS